jgi:hypothetical protein
VSFLPNNPRNILYHYTFSLVPSYFIMTLSPKQDRMKLEPVSPALASSAPSLHREDLLWHEQPYWYLWACISCGFAGGVLGLGLMSLTRKPLLIWVTFLAVVGSLAFGGTLGKRYVLVVRDLWTAHRGMVRPMWRLPEGRWLMLEWTGGWLFALGVGWRLGQEATGARLVRGLLPEDAWLIAAYFGIQYGLWSGVGLMWPVYRWLTELPSRAGDASRVRP